MARLIWDHRWWLIVPMLVAFGVGLALSLTADPDPDPDTASGSRAIPMQYDLPTGSR